MLIKWEAVHVAGTGAGEKINYLRRYYNEMKKKSREEKDMGSRKE